MGTCGTMAGGKRRKSRKTRKSRKMRGGMGYGVGSAINAGAIEYAPSNTSVPMKPDGSVDSQLAGTDPTTNAFIGGRRRRKTRKGKGKKGGRRSRKMRGGAGVYNSGAVGTGFTGAVSGMPGSQTYGSYSSYPVKVPAGNPHTTGADGVVRV